MNFSRTSLHQTSSDSVVELNEVCHSFYKTPESIEVLKDISLTVSEGDILSIIGPSGCGKTTLLRLIAGLIKPTTGVIKLRNLPPESFLAKGNTGFVFQNPILFPWRTVFRNLMLVSEIKKTRQVESDKKLARELIQITGLEGFEESYPNQLSGGMLQRATLARALMQRPEILLGDEVFSALDEMTREQLWLDFSKIWVDQNLTVILVTHSIREAVFLSNRVLVMSNRPGKIKASFDIPFPRPRHQDLLLSSEFTATVKAIRGELS